MKCSMWCSSCGFIYFSQYTCNGRFKIGCFNQKSKITHLEGFKLYRIVYSHTCRQLFRLAQAYFEKFRFIGYMYDITDCQIDTFCDEYCSYPMVQKYSKILSQCSQLDSAIISQRFKIRTIIRSFQDIPYAIQKRETREIVSKAIHALTAYWYTRILESDDYCLKLQSYFDILLSVKPRLQEIHDAYNRYLWQYLQQLKFLQCARCKFLSEHKTFLN